MRNYIVASWNDADQYDYSGEMLGGSRHQGRSQKVHFNPDGSACVASYGDVEPKTTKVPLRDRILPQFKRVQTLTAQLVELEQEYRAGVYDINEYSTLRAVVVTKRNRAQVLYEKAISVKEPTQDEDRLDNQDNTLDSFDAHPDYTEDFTYTNNDSSTPSAHVASDVGVRFIDELSHSNSLKKPLRIACTLIRTAVRWHQAARNYINELKGVYHDNV